LQNLIIPKSQDSEPLAAEPFIPLQIIIFFFCGMLPAVYFYNQALFISYEINDIIADGLLSPEFDALQMLVLQMEPKAIFGVGGSPSQNSGNLSRSFPNDYATPTPALPHQGGGRKRIFWGR